MKTPAPPPNWRDQFDALLADPATEEAQGLLRRLTEPLDDSEYLPWDALRYKTPPTGLDADTWWTVLKFRRQSLQRHIQLFSTTGDRFHYALTDRILKLSEEVTRRASGEISLPELAMSKSDRDRYVVSSLIEEAITSSQLEGASTSRAVAKQMIRSGRRPVNRSEQMILNNYRAMRRIQEVRDQRLTPELILEVHRMVTESTLDDPRDAGHVQEESEDRIAVYADDDELLHRPPHARELTARMERLCDFANGDLDGDQYFPPVVRAIIVHFMMGYDHYFVDGNGRTARTFFYWSMLNQGYWLTEYVTISKILKNAPSKYAGSFLLSEHDDGDLTYFVMYHLQVLTRALDELEIYLRHKAQDIRDVRQVLDASLGDFNYRQLAILDKAAHDGITEFTVRSHSLSHAISTETARSDLRDLQQRGLLTRSKRGKEFMWRGTPDLRQRLVETRSPR